MTARFHVAGKSRFRIGIYIADLRPGGVTRFAMNLAGSLGALGHSCVIVADQGPLPESQASIRVSVLQANSVLSRLRGLREIVRKERLDVVISNGWFADAMVGLVARTLRRPPKIVSVTHIRPGHWGMTRSSKLALAGKTRLARWAYDRADLRVAVSQGLAAEMQSGGWSRSEFIPVYSPCSSPQVVVSRKGVGEVGRGPAVHLVAMGWLVPNKGFDLLLRAAALLRGRGPLRVTIVGGESPNDPGYPEVLSRLASDLGIAEWVRFAGVLENPFPILAEGDVFVFPSRSETFGLSLVEAMGLGLPVVAADCPHGPAEILEGGRYGILVRPDDPVALAEGIWTLFKDPAVAHAYQRLGLERASHFSNEGSARRYARMIQELASG